MKKTSISLIFIIALMAFYIWAPDSSAKDTFYASYSCSVCHTPAPVTCAGCHRHGTKNFTATTNKLTYEPGESITVSISGGTKDEPGWVRLILYDQDGHEVARSTGSSGRGGGPGFPGPIKLIATAPTDPGIYTLSASWYGYSTSTNASNFEPDTNNVLAANHGWVNIATDEFEVVSLCDTNAPMVTAPAAITIMIPAGMTSVPDTDPAIDAFLNDATATDAEDGDLPVTNNAPVDFPVGTTPVTFFATDSCNNQRSATANVTVEVADNNLPVVTVPAPIEVTAQLCATSVTATNTDIAAFLKGATAFDAEDGNVTDSITNDAPADFPAGTVTTVTFTAADSLGANGTATAAVTVNETPNTGPAVTAPAAITIIVPAGTASVPATDTAIAAFLKGATAMDVEDGDVTTSITNDAPAEFLVGTTSVNFSVADSCGVSASAASTVTIQEENGNIAPVLNVPDQITVYALNCAILLPATNPDIDGFLNGATATDAEDGDVTASITNNAPADFPIGTTPVTFSVTDSNGATTTGVASVVVAGANNAPVVIGPAPLSFTVAAGTTSVPATDTAVAAFLNNATAIDAEDGDFPSSSITNNAPADFSMGVTTVTFSVKDGCGLTATASSTVTITEDLPPVTGDLPSEEETDDEIDDDEKENKHYKKKKYEKENKHHNEEKQSSTKLRLLRGEED